MADTVLQMDRYVPKEITSRAKEAAGDYPSLELPKERAKKPVFERKPRKNPGIVHKGRIKIKTMGKDGVQLNHETVDLRYVEQLADYEQLTCLGYVLKYMEENMLDGKKTVQEIVEELMRGFERKGFETISDGGYLAGNLAFPRKQEIYACVNRYRGLKL